MMKLAFSTLGCSGLPLAEVAAMAVRTGWTGLELRSAPDEPVHTGLSPDGRRAALAELAGATVLCVASYVKVASDAADDEVTSALLAEAELAADLGARAVRVFPGGPGDGGDDERAVRRLRAVAPKLPSEVEVWLETHDSHPRGRDVARIVSEVADPAVRAIWDAAHPWRAGEAVAETMSVLGPWLAHVQVKDRPSSSDPTPVPLGDGYLPLLEVLAALRDAGYDGWLSLEWEHKWHPAPTPLEEVLVAGRAWLAHNGFQG